MKELNFKQELTAAFGQPIAENPTQVMIEAAYRHHNLDWRYLTIEVGPNDLEAAVKGAKVMGFQGFNCTIPHKVKVIEYLDGLGQSASLMGAVNCVVRRDGQWIGENTDGKGFVSSLREITDPERKKVVIFGAGGAARAISVEIALAGASHVTIVNRSADRGEELTTLLQDNLPCYADFTLWDSTYSIPEETDVVINATSIGLFPDVDARLNINPSSLSSSMVVADVIPNPPATNLVRGAREKGCKVIDGLGMLVNQGVIGIRHWTGIDPDPKVMRSALEEVFA
jgi:shikimate dehydrogenase